MLHRVPHLSLEVITEKGVEIKGDDLSLNLPEFGVIDTPSQVPAVLHHGRNGPSDDLPRVRRSLQPSLDHVPGRLDFLPNGWGTAQDTKKNLDMLTDDLLKGIRNEMRVNLKYSKGASQCLSAKIGDQSGSKPLHSFGADPL